MAESYLGEIKLVSFTKQMVGWYPCDGRLVQIAGNEALFALIGTTYGGDGSSTFAVPDLRGRLPIGLGQGAGLTNNWAIGQVSGTEAVTLTAAQMPPHTHNLMVSKASTSTSNVSGAVLATPTDAGEFLYVSETFGTEAPMDPDTVAQTPTSATQPHPNMMPSIALQYVICYQGIYPERNS